MDTLLNRRDFLGTVSAATIGMAVPSGFASPQKITGRNETISVGVIGVGARGRYLLDLLSSHPKVHVAAICDIDAEAIEKTQKILVEKGKAKAEAYTGDVRSYQQLLEKNDIDGVLVATPWEWHVPMAVEAMKAGKYVGLEVPAATTIEGCWDLVKTHEETGAHLMFLENCCYDREALAVLNMLRDGIFGTPIHATCGYRHSSYGSKSWLDYKAGSKNETDWRKKYSLKQNADLYPTHGIGPVANWFNINRGNRFSFLTSVASKSAAIRESIMNHPEGGPDHPNARLDWKQGDIVTTIIKTASGETIIINYDTKLPRPYSRDYGLQGTNGIWSGTFNSRSIYINGRSPKKDQWEVGKAYDAFFAEYEHPIWKKDSQEAETAGHGGIDYYMIQDFVRCMVDNKKPPIDVYDAAAWSAIFPLSEMSIASGSQPVFFPDFTNGRWLDADVVF